MARINHKQLNVRSSFAHERATRLAQDTGLTTTQVVEEALRAYTPPPRESPPGMVWEGPILVMSGEGRRMITIEEANAAIDDARQEREDDILRSDRH